MLTPATGSAHETTRVRGTRLRKTFSFRADFCATCLIFLALFVAALSRFDQAKPGGPNSLHPRRRHGDWRRFASQSQGIWRRRTSIGSRAGMVFPMHTVVWRVHATRHAAHGPLLVAQQAKRGVLKATARVDRARPAHVPGFLRAQGYATAMFGKWHLG